jgi:uncharacterized membrane protein
VTIDERYTSRKFLIVLLMMAITTGLNYTAHIDASTLANIWIFVIGGYFGANIGEKYVKGKTEEALAAVDAASTPPPPPNKS